MNRPLLKIISDGTSVGTRVYDANGTNITAGITRIEWSIKPYEAGQVKLTIDATLVAVEVQGKLKELLEEK